MSLTDALNLVLQIFFVALGVLTIVDYGRHKGAIRRDVALLFGILAVPFLIQLAAAALSGGQESTGASALAIIGLVLEPYLVLRLVRYLRSLPSYMLRLALFSMVATIVIGVIAGPRLPILSTLVSAAYLIGFNLYAMVSFVRATTKASGMTERRLHYAAVGAGLFSLVLVAIFVAALFPQAGEIITLIAEVLAIACTLAFYIGFVPPRWLRRTWQMQELREYLAQTRLTSAGNTTLAEAFAHLSETASEATSSMASGVVRREEAGGQWETFGATDNTVIASALANGGQLIEQAWQNHQLTVLDLSSLRNADERRPLEAIGANTWLLVPITAGERIWGLLLVFLQHGSIFIEDDVSLLELATQQTAMLLENYRLFGELRSYSEQLERKVEDRTAALTESEERFRQIIETAQEGIWVTDADNQTTLVNPEMVEMLGYSSDEMLATSLFAFLDDEDKASVSTLATSNPAQAIVGRRELKFRCKDGDILWTLASTNPLTDPAGNPAGALTMITDITERKRAEQEVHLLNGELEQRVLDRTAQLEAANKELEAFSYSVSHDLRAPLRSIDGFSRILLEDYGHDLSPDVQRYLNMVREDTQQMGRLIDDLLTFSRLSRQDLKKQKVNPAIIVNVALGDLLSERAGRTVDINVGDLPLCEADPGLLKQVYVNLLSNALKYTRKREHATVEVGSLHEDDKVVYYVKDNGVGFNMRYAPKLFSVFQRLHSSDEYEGTGVGLAIVQRVVHRHGGRVWADAEENRGAAFYFTLEGDADHG